MKKVFYALAAVAFLATSCSKEELTPGTGDNNSGTGSTTEVPGNLKILLRTDGKPVTASTEDGETSEKTVTDIMVYVFRRGDGSELLEDFKKFNSENVKEEMTMAVSTGQKHVVVLANYASYPTDQSIGDGGRSEENMGKVDKEKTTYTQFKDRVMNLKADNQAPFTGLKNDNTFLMSGFAEADVTPAAPSTQSDPEETSSAVTVNLTRFAGKVSLKNTSADVPGSNDNITKFTIKGIKVGNVAKSFYTFLHGGTSWTIPTLATYWPSQQDESASETDQTKRLPITTKPGYYTDSRSQGWTTTDNVTQMIGYVSENGPAQPQMQAADVAKQGTTTYVLVKGVLEPKKIYKKDGTSELTVGDETTDIGQNKWQRGSTFYRVYVKKDNTQGFCSKYFGEKPDGTTTLDCIKTDMNNSNLQWSDCKVVEYPKAECYYRVWFTRNNTGDNDMGPDNVYYHAIRRNEWFKINLTTVTDCGMNDEDQNYDDQDKPVDDDSKVDPEQPVEPVSNLQFTITVEDWKVVNQNTPLG